MSAQSLDISRRRFIASTGLAATAVCFVPHRFFGDEENLVVAARNGWRESQRHGSGAA
jgi:hypothetical protein